MDKFFAGAVSTKSTEPRKKARIASASTSSCRLLPSPIHNTEDNLLKNIIPSSYKRKEPSGTTELPPSSASEQVDLTIQKARAFATNKNPAVQSSYLLSILPSKEVNRWNGDNQLRAKYCMKHLASLNAGLAGLLHEAIAGENPSSVALQKLTDDYKAEAAKAKALEAELKASEAKTVRQAEQIKAQASKIAGHQSALDELHAKLRLTEEEAVAKEVAARQETRESFLSSPPGIHFLDLFRKELLNLYHDSMPFLGRLYPAAKQYLLIGATRALEQARATGKLDGFNEPDLLLQLPDPEGWSGDSSLSLDYPWWETALEKTMHELKLEEARGQLQLHGGNGGNDGGIEVGVNDMNSPNSDATEDVTSEPGTPITEITQAPPS